MTLDEEQLAMRRVVCAANIYKGVIICGARHFDSVMHQQINAIKAAGGELIREGYNQGFIDQFGNFLTREEAWVIAERQGQIIRRCGGDEGKLFSENLY